MNIAIIGSGNVGGALAKRLAEVGHNIYLGVRDLSNFKGKELINNISITATAINKAVKEAEVIIISVPSGAMVDIASKLGDVSGKIIIDTSNTVMSKPEGFGNGFEVLVKLTNCKDIVKGFNTTGAENMLDPNFNGIKLDMFTAGDSQKGKEMVKKLSQQIGFGQVYDFGGNDKVSLIEEFAKSWINLAIMQKYGRDIGFKILLRNKPL